jgi:hypothetical protein
MLFSLLLGAGLLVQESEQRTLLFLDGLPVSRSRIFAMKALAAFLIISLVPLLDVISDLAFSAISRTSIDPPFAWNFMAAELGLQMLAGAFLVGLALLVSFTRAWFALITGLLMLGFLWLRQRGVHWLACFDTYALLGPAWVKSKVLVPWPQVAGHIGGVIGSFGLAWIAFLSLGDRTQYALDRLGRLRWLGALGVGARWIAPVAWIAALVMLAKNSDAPGVGSDAPLGESAFAHRETRRYDFLYRTAQAKAAKPIMDIADGIYDQVAKYLGASPGSSRVVVDLASAVMTHAAGQTNWTKIRMPLEIEPSLEEQRIILGHETTHVFIEQLSDVRFNSHFNECRCFHEGLATAVELQLFSTDAARTLTRRAIAGAWSRGKVPLELLMNDSELGKKREPNLAYPLGEAFAQAISDTHGREAPARVLRAFARQSPLSGQSGAELWRDAMQTAGVSFDRVAAAYEVSCADAVRRDSGFVNALPQLHATVRVRGGDIVVQPIFQGVPPGRIVCFTMDDDPVAPQFSGLVRHKDGTFTWPVSRHTGPVFRYLLGWQTTGTRLPVFEPWAVATLK